MFSSWLNLVPSLPYFLYTDISVFLAITCTVAEVFPFMTPVMPVFMPQGACCFSDQRSTWPSLPTHPFSRASPSRCWSRGGCSWNATWTTSSTAYRWSWPCWRLSWHRWVSGSHKWYFAGGKAGDAYVQFQDSWSAKAVCTDHNFGFVYIKYAVCYHNFNVSEVITSALFLCFWLLCFLQNIPLCCSIIYVVQVTILTYYCALNSLFSHVFRQQHRHTDKWWLSPSCRHRHQPCPTPWYLLT